MHSWRVLILPYIEEMDLYEQYDFSEPWDSPNNRKLLDQRPTLFQLHGSTDDDHHATNYLAVVGPETVWPIGKTVNFYEIPDGPSSVISIVENTGSGIAWTEPRDLSLDSMNMEIDKDPANGISSWFFPPAVATADGQVLRLDVSLSAEELRSMLVINDGIIDTGKAIEIRDGRNRPRKQQSSKK